MSTGKAIVYTVSEINVDTRYETPKAQNVTLTSGNVDLTVNVNFNNELKTGSIKINKQSEDGENGGREFTVTGNGKTYSIKTGSDGIAILSDIPVYDSNNEKIVYTISEKNVPVKYVVPADQTATLTADATTTKTFKNVLKKFTAQVTKQDSETVSAQGDGTLAGAVYGIYRDGELIDTTPQMKTDISRQKSMSAETTLFRKFRQARAICLMKQFTQLVQKLRIISLSITHFL